ncbi:MAG: type II secretion system protein [Candidatus Taylorbacteria bacterium]|nr:type II secretion system protein [Candidatus Taylorbacteria bacterium]
MKKYGFTLVEIMTCLMIIIFLTALIFPAFNKVRQERHNLENPKPMTAEQEQQIAIQNQSEMNKKLAQIQDFGNGVYYFPFVDDEFRKMVSKFLDIHTNLEVVASDGDIIMKSWGDSAYGITVGHTVLFREKK